MLRISRRAGERIMLGDDTIIEVLEVRGQTVRIGIDAPRALKIYREEIWLEVKRENQAAAQAAGTGGDLPDVTGRLKPRAAPGES
jgi:carbon storage regulator